MVGTNWLLLISAGTAKDSPDETFSLVLPLTEIDEAFKQCKTHIDFKIEIVFALEESNCSGSSSDVVVSQQQQQLLLMNNNSNNNNNNNNSLCVERGFMSTGGHSQMTTNYLPQQQQQPQPQPPNDSSSSSTYSSSSPGIPGTMTMSGNGTGGGGGGLLASPQKNNPSPNSNHPMIALSPSKSGSMLHRHQMMAGTGPLTGSPVKGGVAQNHSSSSWRPQNGSGGGAPVGNVGAGGAMISGLGTTSASGSSNGNGGPPVILRGVNNNNNTGGGIVVATHAERHMRKSVTGSGEAHVGGAAASRIGSESSETSSSESSSTDEDGWESGEWK